VFRRQSGYTFIETPKIKDGIRGEWYKISSLKLKIEIRTGQTGFSISKIESRIDLTGFQILKTETRIEGSVSIPEYQL